LVGKLYEIDLAQTSDHLSVSRTAGNSHLFHGPRIHWKWRRGNWITLEFRGLIFWTYITLLAIDVILSSIVVLSFPKSGVLRIHFWSMVFSVILLVTGVVVYGKVLRAQAIST